MRLFVAIAFDSETKGKISLICDAMRRKGVTGSFTPSGNLHLTLKFLGEVEPTRITAVKAAIDNAALTVNRFNLRTGRCGFFASRGEKTVWLGMEGDGLFPLAEAVDSELHKTGFEPERRAFAPHVTLTRRADFDTEILSLVEVPQLDISVDAITLFESRRDGGRLWYKPVYSAPLCGI